MLFAQFSENSKKSSLYNKFWSNFGDYPWLLQGHRIPSSKDIASGITFEKFYEDELLLYKYNSHHLKGYARYDLLLNKHYLSSYKFL